MEPPLRLERHCAALTFEQDLDQQRGALAHRADHVERTAERFYSIAEPNQSRPPPELRWAPPIPSSPEGGTTLLLNAIVNRPGFDAHLLAWGGCVMPRKYDQETKSKAIRLVIDHVGDYGSEWEAITTVAGRLGMSAETLRKWVRQAGIDAGQAPGSRTHIFRLPYSDSGGRLPFSLGS
jgi:hypothetical protein